MMYMNSLSPIEIVLATIITILVFAWSLTNSKHVKDFNTLSNKYNISLKSNRKAIERNIEILEFDTRLSIYTDSIEIKANQVSQYADSVKLVSDETIEENNRLKIQLTEKESLIKKYKFENKELIDHNQINDILLDNNVETIKILNEECYKRDFIIEDLKQDKDSLIQQLNNYKIQNDAVNQLIKNNKDVLSFDDGIAHSKKGQVISRTIGRVPISKRKRHG